MRSKLEIVVDYVRYHATMIGIREVGILDNNFDEVIPKGTTYVMPKGAVIIDPSWHPEFDFSNGAVKLINPPRLLFLLPELIFRIDKSDNGDEVVTGMSSFTNKFVDKVNAGV